MNSELKRPSIGLRKWMECRLRLASTVVLWEPFRRCFVDILDACSRGAHEAAFRRFSAHDGTRRVACQKPPKLFFDSRELSSEPTPQAVVPIQMAKSEIAPGDEVVALGRKDCFGWVLQCFQKFDLRVNTRVRHWRLPAGCGLQIRRRSLDSSGGQNAVRVS
ncbi:hypothetical protein SCHPADRAFT_307292 [Schizopora paradoxa]|uniref:Uncharacterized protein n=1 Tax=Schizopora paradoxa TaxID=27342 RepID=A0A0H2RYG7_9AGAM|nr:hypothetical protein SCHPADRAFT_307292 [Schizopora paradoxa]